MTLSANVTQGGSIDITVKDRIGASVGDDISNIKIGKMGGTNVDILNLRTEGNIVQQANAPVSVADRINLTSTLGGVYGENNSYFRLQGGQQIVGGDSLSASVNVTANKDIRVQQTTGDLRIGKFHTDNGDVYISVPQGGIVDALPYVERTPMEENELLDLWKSMGMIEGGDSDLNADKNKALANTNGTVYENYCAGVQEAFSRFTTISAKPEADRTQAEKDTLAVYQKQFKTPDSPDDSPAYFASAADFLAQDTQAAKLAEIGQTRQETYKVWDKDLLLYQIDDAIVNHHAGVVLPEKDPNIFGKNINISVQNGVGLNSDKVTEINMEHLDKNSLKFLSQVDPSTVTWKTNESNESIAVITDRLAIGLQQSGVGSINITTAGNAKSNVFLENRLDDTLNLADPYKNLDIAKILAGAGNVTVTSLGSIYDVNTLTGINVNGYATVATISGNNVMLMTGAVGTNNGNIGMAGNFIRLNMSGNLTATATGNIYLEQAAVNGSAKNLNILTMTAGVDGQSYSTTSGNIYLKAAGNIYSVVQDSRVQGYIRSDSHGQISFDAVGNIGYAEKADGSIDFTKTIRFKNSTVEAEVVSGEVQAHDTVKLHSTAGSINVEGVSTATIDDDKKQAAGGYFNLVELSGTLDNVVITQNGTFNLKNDVEATGAFILNINEYADIGKSIKAKNIIINATSSIELADGIILKAETVTLSTDKVPDLTYGTIADSLTSGGLIAQGATNNYDDVSGKMHFEAGGNTGDVFSTTSAIQANELQVTASQGIFLGGKNDCNNVALYNAQNSVVYHNVADVDPNETGDVLTVGVLDFLHTSGSDAIVGSVWIYNEAKTETAASGQLTKPMAVTSGVYAVNDIDLKSNGGLVNQYEIESIQGSVYLEAGFENGGYVKEGNLENYGSISTGNEGDNKVEIYATGKLHNHAEGLNGEGNYICGVDGVKITAYKDVINDAHLYALTGDVTVGNNASGTGIEPGKVVNNGNIFVGESGNIQLNSGFTLFNSGVIYSNSGAVNLFAQNSMENTGDIYSVQGDVALQSYIDGLQSTGNIFSGNGSVTLKAKETIKNTGDMFVHGNGSKVTMLSENKDIVNTDDLRFNSDVFKSLTGIDGPTQSIYAYGGIELLAEQGNLYNSKELRSHGDIVLKAKGDIIIESDPGLGDEVYLDETSGTTRIKNIKTTGGSVTIEGRNVVNNMTVEAKTGITVKATADRDGSDNPIVNTGTIKIQSNNGHFITESGNVELTANGYWEHNAYKDETDPTKQQKFSISNGGVNDLITHGGDIILHGKYSVENVGDIKAKKVSGEHGSAFLTSDSGNIYNYEYANNVVYLEFTEIDFSTLDPTTDLDDEGRLIKNAVKDTWAEPDGTKRPRAIDVEGSIYWEAVKIYNEVGQYAGDDLEIIVEEGGTILNKITAGGNVILNCQGGNFTFGGAITAGKGIKLYNTNGSLTILDGASMSAGEDININAGDYVQSGMKIEAGQGVSVYSENGYVKLDNGITANDGLIRVYSQNDTAATGATTHNVEIGGTLYSANGSINISTNSGGIQAENMLAKDLAAVASLEGNVKITGNTKGQKVTFYTEDEAAELTFNKVQFGDEIIMAANGGPGGRSIDMSQVEALSDDYKMGLYGAGRSTGKGNYTLDYEDVDGKINISNLKGDVINIIANEEVKIDNISVSREANIYTMGSKTKIYGTMGPTDAASNEIYYAPGGSQSIDLHEVFFDDVHPTPPNPGTRNTDKSQQVQKMMEDSSQFVTNHGGGGKGMSLHIVDSSLQYGSGIVLMDTYGSNVMANRYSATDIMIYLENMKAQAQFDNYFNIGFNFYERYNNIYIPDVTVNSIALTNKGMENNGIVIVPAKDSDEYEF
ncbi:MAG: hypothetical protein MJ048_04995 [Acidaminococcaceae bacterium]|nr:hypothetical protein [Acidaminococcaceae bacterium]